MSIVKIPFNGPSYKGPSNNINAQECVNFIHSVDNSGGKGQLSLIGRFGLDLFSTIGISPIRGMIEVGDTAYVAANEKFFSLNNSGEWEQKGTLDTNGGNVGIASNGLEIVIVDGTSGYSYLIATDDFAKITDGGFSGGNDVQLVDHFFVVDNLTNGTAQVSAQDDGRTWNALDKATPESDPDGLVRCMSIHSTIWMMGEVTIEPWYDAGIASGFPFLRQTAGVIDMGLAARWGAVKADNTIYFLAQNKEGLYGVCRISGASAQKISTLPLDYELRGYETVLDCVAFSFTDAGHTFVVFTFPTANKTWVFDSSTELWSEWRSWGKGAFRCAFHMYYNRRHILGDRTAGNIYSVNWETFDDGGDFIEGIRTAQHISSDGKEVEWNSIEIFAETGVGPAEESGDEEPVLMLSCSDDGGHTFGNEAFISLGWQGQYKKRLIRNRQGSSRDRAWRTRITSKCKRVIMGAVANISIGVE